MLDDSSQKNKLGIGVAAGRLGRLLTQLLLMMFIAPNFVGASGHLDIPLARFPATPRTSLIRSLVMEHDKGLLLAGDFTSFPGAPSPYMARILSNAQPDPHFPAGGGLDGAVALMIVQDDGRIIIAGSFRTYGGVQVSPIIRLEPDGRLDETFRLQVDSLLAEPPSAITQLVKHRSGQISIVVREPHSTTLLRLDHDGTETARLSFPDPWFGNGAAFLPLPDGRVLGWYSPNVEDSTTRQVVFRSDLTVERDLSEGFPRPNVIRANAMSSDGSLYLALTAGVVHRFTADFQLNLEFTPEDLKGIVDMVVQPDGKLLIAGGTGVLGRVMIRRFHPSGAPDDCFYVSEHFRSGIFTRLLVDSPYFFVAGSLYESPSSTSVPTNSLLRYHLDLTSPDSKPFLIRNGAPNPSLAAATVAVGQSHTFSVRAYGCPAPELQWYFNGRAIPGATAASLTLTNLVQTDTGDYTVEASNRNGKAGSDPGRLSVLGATPYLFPALENITLAEGQYLKIPSYAQSLNPLTYQWYFQERPLAGQIGPECRIREVLATNAGHYFVVVSNLAGTVTSATARVTLTSELTNPGATVIGFNTRNGLVISNSVIGQLTRHAGFLSDGSVFVAGLLDLSTTFQPRLLDRQGMPDPSFHLELKRGRLSATIWNLLVLPDDSLLLSGDFDSVNGEPCPRLVRVDRRGSRVSMPRLNLNPADRFSGPVLEPGGTFLLFGSFTNIAGEPRRGIARFDLQGNLFPKLEAGLPQLCVFTGLWVRDDGMLYATGKFDGLDRFKIAPVARFSPDGVLDSRFNCYRSSLELTATELVCERDGSLLVLGSYRFGQRKGALFRLRPDGSFDDSFQFPVPDLWAVSSVGSVTLQADGKILVGGHFTSAIDSEIRSEVGRLLPDGRWDETFATRADAAKMGSTAPRTLLRDDNAILMYGDSFGYVNDTLRWGLALLHGGPFSPPNYPSQVLTNTLPQGGKLSLDGFSPVIPRPSYRWVHGSEPLPDRTGSTLEMANLQPDASGQYFVIASNAYGIVTQLVAVVEVAPPDHRFGKLYPRAVSLLDPAGGVRAVAAAPGSGWLIGGDFRTWGESNALIGLAKLDQRGELDSTFRSPLMDRPERAIQVRAICTATDGKILIGGRFSADPTQGVEDLAQLLPNGRIDLGFEGHTNLSRLSPSIVRCLHRTEEGKVLVGGTFTLQLAKRYLGLFRLTKTGAWDESFTPLERELGPGGLMTECMLPDSKDRLLVGGAFSESTGVVFRIQPDGQLDSSFVNHTWEQAMNVPYTCFDISSGGAVPDPHPHPVVYALARDRFGRVLVGGAFVRCDGVPCYNLVRLSEGGKLDLTFDTGQLFGQFGIILTVACLPDGTIAAGTCGGQLLRFSDDGSLREALSPGANSPLFPANRWTINFLLPQPDGGVVVGGTFPTLADYRIKNLVRILGDPFLANPRLADHALVADTFTLEDREYSIQGISQWDEDLRWQTIGSIPGTGTPTTITLGEMRLPAAFFRLEAH